MKVLYLNQTLILKKVLQTAVCNLQIILYCDSHIFYISYFHHDQEIPVSINSYASDSQIKVAVRGLTAGIKDLTVSFTITLRNCHCSICPEQRYIFIDSDNITNRTVTFCKYSKF